MFYIFSHEIQKFWFSNLKYDDFKWSCHFPNWKILATFSTVPQEVLTTKILIFVLEYFRSSGTKSNWNLAHFLWNGKQGKVLWKIININKICFWIFMLDYTAVKCRYNNGAALQNERLPLGHWWSNSQLYHKARLHRWIQELNGFIESNDPSSNFSSRNALIQSTITAYETTPVFTMEDNRWLIKRHL